MKPSAAARSSIANRRALWTMSRPCSAASPRVTPFQNPPFPCHQIAASVWSGVRAVLLIEPSSLTSLKSSAYAWLVSAFGPSERTISALGSRNGRTSPTHGAGSCAKNGIVGRHTPGTVPTSVPGPPPRPSRSEEHTSELQSRPHLVCRLLLEKKKKVHNPPKKLKKTKHMT